MDEKCNTSYKTVKDYENKETNKEFSRNLKERAKTHFPLLRDKPYHPIRAMICKIIGHMDDLGGIYEVCSRCGQVQQDISPQFGWCLELLGYIPLDSSEQTINGEE